MLEFEAVYFVVQMRKRLRQAALIAIYMQYLSIKVNSKNQLNIRIG